MEPFCSTFVGVWLKRKRAEPFHKKEYTPNMSLGAAIAGKNNLEISNLVSFVRRLALHLHADLHRSSNWMDLPMIEPTATIHCWGSDTVPARQFLSYSSILSFLQLLTVPSKWETKTKGMAEELVRWAMGAEEPSQ
jgi:hypothetical protein